MFASENVSGSRPNVVCKHWVRLLWSTKTTSPKATQNCIKERLLCYLFWRFGNGTILKEIMRNNPPPPNLCILAKNVSRKKLKVSVCFSVVCHIDLLVSVVRNSTTKNPMFKQPLRTQPTSQQNERCWAFKGSPNWWWSIPHLSFPTRPPRFFPNKTLSPASPLTPLPPFPLPSCLWPRDSGAIFCFAFSCSHQYSYLIWDQFLCLPGLVLMTFPWLCKYAFCPFPLRKCWPYYIPKTRRLQWKISNSEARWLLLQVHCKLVCSPPIGFFSAEWGFSVGIPVSTNTAGLLPHATLFQISHFSKHDEDNVANKKEGNKDSELENW